MKTILVVMLLVSCQDVFSKEKVVYKYKQYEKFDLGDMEIKGEIIAPGDISVKERQRKIFHRNLYQRKNFDDFIIQEIKYLR